MDLGVIGNLSFLNSLYAFRGGSSTLWNRPPPVRAAFTPMCRALCEPITRIKIAEFRMYRAGILGNAIVIAKDFPCLVKTYAQTEHFQQDSNPISCLATLFLFFTKMCNRKNCRIEKHLDKYTIMCYIKINFPNYSESFPLHAVLLPTTERGKR